MTALQKISQGEIPPKKTTDSAIARQFLAATLPCDDVIVAQRVLYEKVPIYRKIPVRPLPP